MMSGGEILLWSCWEWPAAGAAGHWRIIIALRAAATGATAAAGELRANSGDVPAAGRSSATRRSRSEGRRARRAPRVCCYRLLVIVVVFNGKPRRR